MPDRPVINYEPRLRVDPRRGWFDVVLMALGALLVSATLLSALAGFLGSLIGLD